MKDHLEDKELIPEDNQPEETEEEINLDNNEENNEEIVETLAKKYPVWVSDIKNIDDAFYMMRSIAELLDVKNEAEDLLQKIEAQWDIGISYYKSPFIIKESPINS